MYRPNLRTLNILIPLAIGIVFFYLIVGISILDPKFIFWIEPGDPMQQYLGWELFRQSSWSFPLGKNPHFGMGASSSIVFSDSIPLLALLFKPFRAFLSEPFQYFGIWSLVCFALQAVLSWNFIGLFKKDPMLQALGSILCLFLPAFLIRFGFHSYLLSQFLLIAGLYLNFKVLAHRTLWWTLLLSVAGLINFYLFSMVFALWISNLTDVWRTHKDTFHKSGINEIFIMLACNLFIFWQAGYFAATGPSIVSNMYGAARMNVLSIFDPEGWSVLLKTLLPQYGGFTNSRLESMHFLGLGMFFLMPFSWWALYQRRAVLPVFFINHAALVFILVGLTLFAISNQVDIGNLKFVVPLPESFLSLASILRSSGRMFLPVLYAIVLGLIVLICLYFKRRQALIILSLACFIQILDTSTAWITRKSNLTGQASIASNYSRLNTALIDPFWAEAGKRYQNVLTLLQRNPEGIIPFQWEHFAALAAKYRLQTNSAYLARIDENMVSMTRNQIMDSILSGIYDPKSIYIIEDQKLVEVIKNLKNESDIFLRVDGYNVLAPNWINCESCNLLVLDKAWENSIPTVSTRPTYFSKTNSLFDTLIQAGGWCNPEKWGVWSCRKTTELLFKNPTNIPLSLLTINLRALVTPTYPKQLVQISINGLPMGLWTLTNSSDNIIRIPLSKIDLRQKLIQIEFSLPNAIEPRNLDMGSQDDRMLAIGLESIRWD